MPESEHIEIEIIINNDNNKTAEVVNHFMIATLFFYCVYCHLIVGMNEMSVVYSKKKPFITKHSEVCTSL